MNAKTHSNILMSFNFVCCIVCVFCFCFLCSAALLKCILWYLFRNTDFSEKRYLNISAAETWHSCADTEWARGWFKYHVLCFCHWAKPAAFSNEHWQERMWEHPMSLFVLFWRTAFQNPWGVPRGSLLSFFSTITFSVSLFNFLSVVMLSTS